MQLCGQGPRRPRTNGAHQSTQTWRWCAERLALHEGAIQTPLARKHADSLFPRMLEAQEQAVCATQLPEAPFEAASTSGIRFKVSCDTDSTVAPLAVATATLRHQDSRHSQATLA